MGNDFASEYAIALFDLALEKQKVDVINDELKICVKAYLDNKTFIKLLSHPQFDKEHKKGIIKDTFKSIERILLHFFYVLIENDRIADIKFINEGFTKLFNDYNNVLSVIAKTSIPLTDEQIEALKGKLSKKYRHKIEVNNVIDPSVIGGMLLIINNQVFDYTIKNQFQSLKSHILKHT